MAEGKSVSLKAYLAIHESLLMNHEIRATNQKADPPRGGMVPDTFFLHILMQVIVSELLFAML